MMTFTDDERAKAENIWEQYQCANDLSDRRGEIAGIDPASDRVWIGDWFTEVIAQRDAEGIDRPLIFKRIGYSTVLKKLGKGFAH